MNLVIDVGNSYVKVAVFDKSLMLRKDVMHTENLKEHFCVINKTYKSISRAIVSSVGKLNKETIDSIKKFYDVIFLNAETKLPFVNLYNTPKTLGIDRIALVCASISQFFKNNALIIDAGTCITYDFVTANNSYLGGAISPGLTMRYQSLNNLTANLPLLDIEKPKSIIGDSTNSSIHSGVVFGVLKEIEGVIEEYEQKYENLTVILTGGDSNFLSKQLKSSIFANSNFLLEGLNYILQFNSNE